MTRTNSFLMSGFVSRAVCTVLALLFGASFLFTGCTEISDSDSSSETTENSTTTQSTTSGTTTSGTTTSGTTTASESSSWAYSSSSPVYEIDSDVSSVSISGLTSGQTIYLAKTNAGSTSISSSYARYVSAATNVTLSSAESSSSSSSSGLGSSGPSHFIAPVDLTPSQFTRASSLDRSAASASVTQLTLTVGSTTKSIYVDQDSDISTFAQETATLRAVGTYCNVWVVSDCYTTGSASGEQIDSTIAQALADKFDIIYPMVRNVFGDESENILAYNAGSITETAMSNYDDTGTYTVNSTSGDKVNIVVYDIGADYSSSSSSGVVGYFYAKDYYKNTGSTLSSSSGYKVIDYSNTGKYFYIDAYYAVSYTDMVYSTLAHEFQHMVDFGVKDMDQDLSPSTWYNEMLSMLSEDMMQTYLGINSTDYDDSPEDRLCMFERCYKDVGLEYLSTSTYYTLASYSNNYAFGAWIARQFGGAEVIAAISRNSSVDVTSIVNAVNSVNSTSYTISDLLKMYAESCIFSDTTLSMPTFNQESVLDSTSTYYYTANSYGYPLPAIDLWNLDDMFSSSFTSSYSNTTYYKYDGPKLYGYNAAYEIRPYGMTLCKIGTATGSTATITFSTTGTSSEHLYVMVQ